MSLKDDLRAAADFLETRPTLEAIVGEKWRTHTLNAFPSKEQIPAVLPAVLRELGRFEKLDFSTILTCRRNFGLVAIDINLQRSEVCRAVVVGKKIVPAQPAKPEQEVDDIRWECEEPLLRLEEEASHD